MSKKKTHEDFVKEVLDMYGEKYIVVGAYIDSKTPIEVHCTICKSNWNPRPSNFTKGNKNECYQCGIKIRASTNNLRKRDMFVKELEISNPFVELIGEYSKSDIKTIFKCLNCEKPFDAIPRNVKCRTRDGNGCPHCRTDNSKKSKRKKGELKFLNEINKMGYKLIGSYNGSREVVELKCEKHGTFTSFPNSVGCKKCGYEQTGHKLSKSINDFEIEFLNQSDCNEYIYEHKIIQNYSETIKIKHLKCGNVFPIKAGRFVAEKSKTRCPNCNDSKGEKTVSNFLSINSINYESQTKFENCRNLNRLPFDFYIDKKLLIEYDGEDHFYPIDRAGRGWSWANGNYIRRLNHDKIKNQYCIDNKIPLLRIPYWEQKNIEIILESALMHYNIIPKTDSYNYSLIAEWIVDSDWDHDEYIGKCPKNQKDFVNNSTLVNY